jgi:hypothetical protein
MSMVLTASANPLFDELLDDVCAALRLTDAQHQSAETKYKGVGEWLAQTGSGLALYRPEIYPQGSVALQTTVKPRTKDACDHEEYDVDLVCQILAYHLDPMTVYWLVVTRLREHKDYAGRMELLKRCIRLNYAGQFHLDILPAIPDGRHGGTCVLVPDRKLKDWTESNPRGFAHWFRGRAVHRLVEARKTEPLPANEPSARKAPLKRAVQLLKRHRDVVFNGDDDAPRSVVLTTLAGHHYAGEARATDALLGVLNGIIHEIEATSGPLVVRNPTNEAEIFSEAWAADPTAYRVFVDYIYALRDKVEALLHTTGMEKIAAAISELFGETIARKAVESYTQRQQALREDGKLRFSGSAGLTIASNGTAPIPRNTFFGK